MLNAVRPRIAVAMKRCALVAVAWLLGVTCTAASPITIGTFEIQNDTSDPFFAGPSFVVTNDSGLAGLAATFSDIHLLFDLQNLTSRDFSLAGFLGSGQAVDSSGLADALGQSLLPDLGTVLDAYLTFTLLDAVTNAILPGILSLGPTDPALCAGCTDRMTDFTHGSTLAIRFEAQVPDTAPIPEPMSLLLLGSGLAAGAVAKRWRTR